MATIKAHCNACGGDRNHEILHAKATNWQDDDQGISGGESYETIQCLGCEAVKLRHSDWFSEDERSTITYFPPAVFRRHPAWFDGLDYSLPEKSEFVALLLNEIYVALHNNLTSLAAMGVRALLEKVMVSQSGDLGSFAAHVKKFEELGYVSKKQRERLDVILDAGHAAMHRVYAPKRGDVVILLDIAENIIESVYLHDSQIEQLKLRVPPKKPKGS